ncbi:MAG: precorrin-6y C5,15-methyltransferase (decarboxylating) subunit CbiE [Desulfovibrio sp.]|nr:precorrin-6y C5,15-methyltransferase (decarboxylating) subunit CbiE [Desulfovibrio sp.]
MTDSRDSVIILGKSADQTLPGLAVARREYFDKADALLVPAKILADLPDRYIAKALPLPSRPEHLLAELAERASRGEKVLIIAGGDPLFFGAASSLAARLHGDFPRIIPGASCLATLCARLGKPSGPVISLSLHGRTGDRPLLDALKTDRPICVLTDADRGPDAIAAFLLDAGVVNYDCAVGENLGEENERTGRMSVAGCASSFFSPNSVLLLSPGGEQPGKSRCWAGSCRTKPVVAGAALEALDIRPGQIVWDIGAGSGAIAIKAARIAAEVFAVEQNPDRAMDIQLNRAREGAANVRVVLGKAPKVLDRLPRPDGIFIGGGLSGGDAGAILSRCLAALPAGGRLVAAAILIDTYRAVADFAKSANIEPVVRRIAVSNLSPLGGGSYFKPENPVFLTIFEKP